MQPLILMMKRVTKKDFYGSHYEIDCDPSARLVLIRFIHRIFKIVGPEEN